MAHDPAFYQGRSLRDFLLGLLTCTPASPPSSRPAVVVVGFGRALRPDEPNPTELDLMAMANIGQRIPLIAKGLQADGSEATFDGPPVWGYETAGVFETTTDEATGLQYATCVAAGETLATLDIDADRTAGTRIIHAVGVLIGNDPATEAQTAEITFGPAEDTPPVV